MHRNKNSKTGADKGLLRFAVSNELVASVIFDGLNKNLQLNGDGNILLAIPRKWDIESSTTLPEIERYDKYIPLSYNNIQLIKGNCWFVISNGRFATKINNGLLYKVLTDIPADVVTVNVEPRLLPYCEKLLLTSESKVTGFRRLYSDSSQLIPFPLNWPHHIFIKTDILDRVLADHTLSQVFSDFLKICHSYDLTLRAVSIGGSVLDLDTEEGLLGFVSAEFKSSQPKKTCAKNNFRNKILNSDTVNVSDSVRLFGKILFGKNVNVDQNAIIIGPTIIGNDVRIAKETVVRASILGTGVSVPRNYLLQNRVLIGSRNPQKQTGRIKTSRITTKAIGAAFQKNSYKTNFRTWPKFSYAGCLKRIFDIVTAITVLVLFAPIFPIIAIVVKLTSPGPVFFKDFRQGLHGRVFNCLKFRTMLFGADKIQDKLRVLNQADGPQFKMADDPRLSVVGKFLRDTYIDEIPQFLNVLAGQMSVVGPRPSPESENTLCPFWRDARLSVRPGITGLWQVCRTRQPMKDFQEWIHYDIKYVRNLSLRMDLWISWQTLKKMVGNFIGQF
ncbi:MAG: sugar transferase [Planctomycetota bacterium]|jgi:lipopolysaccharide/colanic/teichoic acid biosynthesis glycosyltransferase